MSYFREILEKPGQIRVSLNNSIKSGHFSLADIWGDIRETQSNSQRIIKKSFADLTGF
jgi:hypothetical protein